MVEQSLSIRLKVNDDGSVTLDKFTGKLSQVEKVSKDINLIKWDSITNLGQKILQVTERMYDFGRSVASSLNDIERQSRIIGVSTDQWQKWTYAAKMSDVGADALMTSMKFLSQNIMESKTAGSEADRIFKALGITGGSLEETMYQLADRFSKAEDGETKIAIATKLMGRSAMEIIPYFNQGRAGLEAFAKEAEKYGFIIGKDLIEAGSRAEDSFKRFEQAIIRLKAAAAPLVEIFAKLLEKLVDLAPHAKTMEQIERMNLEAMGINPEMYYPKAPLTEESRYIGRIPTAPVVPKVKLPDILGKAEAKKGVGAVAIGWEDIASGMAELSSDYERIKNYNEILWKDLDKQREIEEKIREIEGDRIQALADEMFPAMDKIRSISEKMEEGAEKQRVKLVEMQNLIKDFGWEDYAAGADMGNDATRQLSIMGIQSEKQLEKTANMGEVFAERMGQAWNFNLKNIVTESENMGDAVRKIFLGISDAFTSAVSKMISDWMLFGSVMGEYEAGKGIIGWIGSAFGLKEGGIIPGWKSIANIPSFATGTVVRRPTLGIIGDNPEGEEAVIPLKGGKIPVEMGKKGGDTYVYFINPIGFDEALMKNMGTILKGVAKDARMAGPMHSIIKGYG